MKVIHNYNIFTKQELVSFLQKYEKSFLYYIDSPYNIILDQKMDAIMKKIDKNLEHSKALSEEFKKTNDGFKYLIESKKKNEEWDRLHKEYDRLEKMRFPSMEVENEV